ELLPHLARAFEIRRALTGSLSPKWLPKPDLDSGAEKLRQLFSLSHSQARLALALFDGLTVRDAAQRLGLTEGTARQYLKQIFARTGTRRQLDLILRVDRALTDK